MATEADSKPYAWDITIRRYDQTEETITRVASTENQARRLGMLRSKAEEVVKLESMTREQYHRSHGARPRRR